MISFKLTLFCLILHQLKASPAEDIKTDDDDKLVARIIRDITGQYHPELHGEHAHRHAHVHSVTSHSHNDGASGGVQVVEVKSGVDQTQNLDSKLVGGYYLPPAPPQPNPSTPPGNTNGYANCGCVPKGHCAPEVLAYMPILLAELKNDVVCGVTQYQLCCPLDPWPGPIDIFKPVLPCIPEEHCVRKYADSPYDIQTYGALGPCLGLGSVRCIEPRPPGPISIVTPIYEYPPVPPPTTAPPTLPPTIPTQPTPVYEPPPPPPVYEPPTVPPTTAPPTIYEPPPTVPTTSPPVVYEPPVTPEPVYEPPAPAYEPPAPAYEPPTPVYEPPTPVNTYELPTPVETYEPPTPVNTYEPPTPVDTYEPPTPVDTYEPPTPVNTYEPPTPVDTYEPPSTDYGVPAVGGNLGVPHRPYRRYPGHYNAYNSRYGSPYAGYRYGYPGYGFRKNFHFSKGFYG